MLNQNDVSKLMGADVYDNDGSKIGTAGQVYLDDQTGSPEWISVRTGLFGKKESFVPLNEASFSGDRVDVPFGKDKVKDAPQLEPDGYLSPAEEDTLYSYYGFSSTAGRLDTGSDTGYATTTHSGDHDRDTDTVRLVVRDSGDDAMTRSEERLTAGTRTEEAGKARLRKYVVTEDQQVTVPVSREEVRLEREPITDSNRDAALSGPEISEAEHEVTLKAERPVVNTETVAVERVRLGKETVTDQETVSGQVRKEAIEFEGDADSGQRR